jgi:hypothetical protein
MASRKNIPSVLHNILGTYTSRYSDKDGYWLFGLLLNDVKEVNINLLNTSEGHGDETNIAAAKRLAVIKFEEQLRKANIASSCIREASLIITRSKDSRLDMVNEHECLGYDLQFVIKAITDLGKTHVSKKSVFVAPHDPKVERRSIRTT